VGVIGVKVWICNGEIFGKRDLSPNIGAKNVKAKPGFNANPNTNSKKKRKNKTNSEIYQTMLQPKKTKFRRQQKGRMKGNAQRGTTLHLVHSV
jgi:ribosomal protein S3